MNDRPFEVGERHRMTRRVERASDARAIGLAGAAVLAGARYFLGARSAHEPVIGPVGLLVCVVGGLVITTPFVFLARANAQSVMRWDGVRLAVKEGWSSLEVAPRSDRQLVARRVRSVGGVVDYLWLLDSDGSPALRLRARAWNPGVARRALLTVGCSHPVHFPRPQSARSVRRENPHLVSFWAAHASAEGVLIALGLGIIVLLLGK